MGEYNQQGRTDRLESLLEIAISVKHTGICKVERGKGGVRQFGKLMFLDGQLVDAVADTRDGLAAWEWLKTWSNCQYIFVVQAREEIKIPAQTTVAPALANTTPSPLNLFSQMIEKVTHSLSDSISFTSAASETPSSGNLSQQNTERPSDPITQPSQMSPDSASASIPYSVSSINGANSMSGIGGSFPNNPNSMSGIGGSFPNNPNSMNGIGGSFPNNPNSMNGINGSFLNNPNSMSGISGDGYSQHANYQWNFLPPSQPSVQPPASVPLRLIDGEEALRFMEKYRLSRHHRHIFFLLNGQRNATDIVRLTRRPLYEIQQVLEELEHYGLIKL